jgi:hypothetical protein
VTLRSIARLAAAGAAVGAGVYAANTAATFARYGRPRRPSPEEADDLLDRFMPVYDIVERHHVRVGAPASITLATAKESDMFDTPVARAIFKGRELLLGSTPDSRERPKGMLAITTSMGWVILDETPDREVVVGAVTKPWDANPVFRSVPATEFAAFAEPDYVKIVWTLRADAIGPDDSVFRTETRAVATDADARRKFRRYWALLSPGISLLRWISLGPLKKEAQRRARERVLQPS